MDYYHVPLQGIVLKNLCFLIVVLIITIINYGTSSCESDSYNVVYASMVMLKQATVKYSMHVKPH